MALTQAEPLSQKASPRRAGLYKRISQDRTGKEAGVKRQDKDGRGLAERLGWEISGEYVDNDISAYNGKRRPAYERMKADLEAGRIDAVIAWHPDRLYRRAKELEALVDLINAVGAEVATVQAGAVDLATPNGRLVARIGAAVAQHESEHKAARTERWHQQRAEEGHPNGGRRAFGFHRLDKHRRADDGTVLPCPRCGSMDTDGHCAPEAALVREIAGRLIGGELRWHIAKDLNSRGETTATGLGWTAELIAQLLKTPRLAGYRRHGQNLHRGIWEPILDEPTWEAANAALKARRPTSGRRAVYPLTGLLFCGLCGNILYGNKSSRDVRMYRCPPQNLRKQSCGKIARNADAIEGHLWDLVRTALDGPGLTAAVEARAEEGETTREILATLSTLEGRLERLKHEYAVEGLWTKTEFLKSKKELEARLADVGGKLRTDDQRRARPVPAGVDLDTWWAAAPPADRRDLVGLVVDKVVLQPADLGRKAFDPSRVEISWRA